jgi:hypothetical protein
MPESRGYLTHGLSHFAQSDYQPFHLFVNGDLLN